MVGRLARVRAARHHACMAASAQFRRRTRDAHGPDRIYRAPLKGAPQEDLMSAAIAAPVGRDVRVISLIGVAHGTSHYYQLAFVTMLLIVRETVGLSFTEI